VANRVVSSSIYTTPTLVFNRKYFNIEKKAFRTMSWFWNQIASKVYFTWKDECEFKMGHFCRINVKLLLNLELSRLTKARKCILG